MNPKLVNEADLAGLDASSFGNCFLVDRTGERRRTLVRSRPSSWLRTPPPSLGSRRQERPDLLVAVNDPSDEDTCARVRSALGMSPIFGNAI